MSIASKITSFKGTGCSKNWVTRFCIQLEYHHFCGRCEGVQGVLNQKRVKESAPWMTMQMEVWMRSELEPWVYVRQSSLTVNKDACSLNACAPRDRWSSVRQRRHWCCAWWAACCTRRSSFTCLWCCRSSHTCSHSTYTVVIVFMKDFRSHFFVFWRYSIYNFCSSVPISVWFIRTNLVPFLFWSRSQEWPTTARKPVSTLRNFNRILNTFFCVSVFSPYNVIKIHWDEDDSAAKCQGSHRILFIICWI